MKSDATPCEIECLAIDGQVTGDSPITVRPFLHKYSVNCMRVFCGGRVASIQSAGVSRICGSASTQNRVDGMTTYPGRRSPRVWCLIAVLQIAVVPMCVAQAQQAQQAQQPQQAQQAVPSVDGRVQPVAVRSGDPSERPLQPGDKLRLTIWREPDMTGEFEVQPNGAINFPKIGRIQVDGLSTDSLRKVILDAYAVSLRGAAIEVTPMRRIVVDGSVRNAGFFYADPTVTVRGALALAGGVTSEGNRKRIYLVRDGKETSINLSSAPNLADAPARSGDQIRVPERSWAARNTAVIASGLSAVAIYLATRVRP